ncbi:MULTISPECIES: Rnf-Nqr domain containing protein [unclassified Pseudomonas]|uniref:Rnf-Nqr domain containing protein n=1 Tax=unclassified Pseudomonas TaxID=196821 RepID=UPI001B344C19|nr:MULTISPECIES: Rnf-Nqr domain containing protein [unclassified Pseudomonas]MBP5947484.1 NADH:quinone oxidoreductase [Pseudomonas sp. P9(2020)]MBZ9565637.1 NADH:quinone oxidoreductase [Pseudomonas sp. P116]
MNRTAHLANSLMLMLLLGTTSSLAGALGAILMFAVVVGAYGLCMSFLRSRLTPAATWSAALLLAATLTSCAEVFAQRWFLPWHQAFGLYAGLIALQCLVLEHNGFFRQTRLERLKLSSLFSALMVILAVVRELAGQGRLGRGLFEHWQGLVLLSEGLPLATLVPGALIVLGLLLAARQAWTRSNSIPKETHRP